MLILLNAIPLGKNILGFMNKLEGKDEKNI